MAMIPADGRGYPEDVRAELMKLATEYPDRDFWQVPVYMGPDWWSSRPCGQSAADIVHRSPEALRAALEEVRDG